MKFTEKFEVRGHKEIRATHTSTFQFTTEPYLTKRGDCIVGINATKSASQLSSEFKTAARKKNNVINVLMEVDGVIEEAKGRGHPLLLLSDARDLVIRKSGYTCSRTLMVYSDKAASDLSRHLIELMKDSKSKMEVYLEVELI